jgi:O-antigen ligase
MPPSLALVLTWGFVAWLFLRDEGRKDGSSLALWLPLAWLFLVSSRFLSQWLSLGEWSGPTTSEDGSPLDAIAFGLLTLAGLVVLAKRRVALGELVGQNPWVLALLAYGLISVLWSDFPFVSIKRWIKALGNPVMALVVLTDPDPARAFRTLMRRLAYLLLPFSVMFIKYFPEYGRGFDAWTGAAFNQGVALTKNGLGQFCMALGIALAWNLQVLGAARQEARRSMEWWVTVGLLAMMAWLIFMSDSKTSQVTLALGLGVLWVLKRFPSVRQRFALWVVATAVVVIGAETLFDVYEHIIRALGRDPNLTDRTEVWQDVFALQPNALLGAGFEAFWLGERLAALWAKWNWQPNQAHSGYVEMYANGGLIGVVLLIGMIVSAFRVIARDLKTGTEAQVEWARLRMALLLVIVVYNYTEATFKGVNLIWTLFYLVAWTVGTRGMPAQAANKHVPTVRAGRAWRRRGSAASASEPGPMSRPAGRSKA